MLSDEITPKMLELVLAQVVRYYKMRECEQLIIKHKPLFYNKGMEGIEEYFMKTLGFRVQDHELNSIIDLGEERIFNNRKRRNIRKFKGSIDFEALDSLADVYSIIVSVLETRHNVRPTHTLDELQYLVNSFPDQIAIVAARLEGEIVAASIVFKYGFAWHTQYLASGELGRKHGALDAVIDYIMTQGQRNGARYLSLGSSTENGGAVLNESLLQYKREFGSLSVPRNTYVIDMK